MEDNTDSDSFGFGIYFCATIEIKTYDIQRIREDAPVRSSPSG